MKTIYSICVKEMDFFFDEDGKLLSYWQLNDAQYRHEYMGPLFKSLGITVKFPEWQDAKFQKPIVKILKKTGNVG